MDKYYEIKKASGGSVEDAEHAFLSSWYIAQEKYDGVRVLAHHDLDGGVRIYTRVSGKNSKVPGDKTSQCAHIANELRKFPKGTVLDGEIIVPRSQGKSHSTRVTSAIGGSPTTAIQFAVDNWYVELAVFDVLFWDGRDLRPYALYDRLEYVNKIGFDRFACYYIFGSMLVTGENHKRKFLQSLWADDREGIILKDLHSPYNPVRNDAWIKVKQIRSFDVVFMGVQDAEAVTTKKNGDTSPSKYAGMVGAIRFGQVIKSEDSFTSGLLKFDSDDNGVTELGTASGFDDATRKDLTENWEKYVGRVFEITAQERLASGRFRHPRSHKQILWRDDKVAADCVYRKDEA